MISLMMIFISVFLFSLAAICNAVMDNITHHWDESIFDKPKGGISKFEMWWNPQYSWINKYVDRDMNKPIKKIFFGLFDKPFTDAWHTFKSAMIVFICLSLASLVTGFIMLDIIDIVLISPKIILSLIFTLIVIIYGTVWNLTFNLFYNKILKK